MLRTIESASSSPPSPLSPRQSPTTLHFEGFTELADDAPVRCAPMVQQ